MLGPSDVIPRNPYSQQAAGPGVHGDPLQPRWTAGGTGPQPHGEMFPRALGPRERCWGSMRSPTGGGAPTARPALLLPIPLHCWLRPGPPPQDHCHYHGRVRGFPDSWVALSTCSGLR